MTEEEPSILEYARFHGLASDHRAINLLNLVSTTTSVLPDPEDPPELFSIDAATLTPSPEKLSVCKGAAVLLSSVRTAPKGLCIFDEEIDFSSGRRGRGLKVELPLLRTDHELDVREFQRRIVPNLADEHLPLEKVNDENDEGLAWPSSWDTLPASINAKISSEKLEIPKNALLFLQGVLEAGRQKRNMGFLDFDDVRYKRSTAWDPITPPLLPLSPPLKPFIPSSDIGHLELLSDHSSLASDIAQDTSTRILKDKCILPKVSDNGVNSEVGKQMNCENESIGDLYTPLKGIHDPPSSLSMKFRRQNHRMETPLTPSTSLRPAPWKAKTPLTSLIQDLPPPIGNPENLSSEEIDALFAESIAPIAQKANQNLEQEQLQRADTICRVKVPLMDFTPSPAPWTNSKRSEDHPVESLQENATIKDIKSRFFSDHLWPVHAKSEKALPWVPFPAMYGQRELQESIEENGTLAELISQPNCVDYKDLTWKRDGLRVLDENDSDNDEIEVDTPTAITDGKTLQNQGRLELREVKDPTVKLDSRELQAEDSNAKHKTFIEKNSEALVNEKGQVLLGGPFTAFGQLENFIDIRKGSAKRRKLDCSGYFSLPIAPPNSNDKPQRETSVSLQARIADPMSCANKTKQTFLPEFRAPTTPQTFIISAKFIAYRRLSRRVQQLYPSAELIERDFDLHANLTKYPSMYSNSPASIWSSDMTNEADVILSPGLGLLWTTVQQLKQRSLPGQARSSSFRDRVTCTALRYEKLMVLVSEGETNEVEMDTNSNESVVGFMGFCSSFESEVQTFLVGGGEEELARCIVNLMIRYGTESNLLQEETLWEIFLRRAGINGFGAQSVLAELKCSERQFEHNPAKDAHESYGLSAFIKMPLEQRVKRFESVFGGSRLLRRISMRLDNRW